MVENAIPKKILCIPSGMCPSTFVGCIPHGMLFGTHGAFFRERLISAITP